LNTIDLILGGETGGCDGSLKLMASVSVFCSSALRIAGFLNGSLLRPKLILTILPTFLGLFDLSLQVKEKKGIGRRSVDSLHAI